MRSEAFYPTLSIHSAGKCLINGQIFHCYSCHVPRPIQFVRISKNIAARFDWGVVKTMEVEVLSTMTGHRLSACMRLLSGIILHCGRSALWKSESTRDKEHKNRCEVAE